MADFVLAAHGPFSLDEAEAQVLQWFEEAGLDVGYVEETAMIAWIDEVNPVAPGLGDLTVEVRFYPLEGHWIQSRWSFRHSEGSLAASLVLELARFLLEILRSDGRWVVDLVQGEGLNE